ncbi:hypothetical protein CCMA1212_008537 [Trichoderma ghanense]|uniref:Uncharacterized protein n=1 Tax=Trichoderma ghanense TaxID=65468 RepID=A0ABY2GVD2_9HYPO
MAAAPSPLAPQHPGYIRQARFVAIGVDWVTEQPPLPSNARRDLSSSSGISASAAARLQSHWHRKEQPSPSREHCGHGDGGPTALRTKYNPPRPSKHHRQRRTRSSSVALQITRRHGDDTSSTVTAAEVVQGIEFMARSKANRSRAQQRSRMEGSLI